MAAPINFEPKAVDPRKELQRRLEAAPREHAESILVALDQLEAAHRKGLLHLVEGAISSKDALFAKVGEYAIQPESTNALRNLLTLGKLAGHVDPDVLDGIAKQSSEPAGKPPSLLHLLLSVRREDIRRGLSLVLSLLGAMGSQRK